MNKLTKTVDINWNGHDHRPTVPIGNRLTLESKEQKPPNRPKGRKFGDDKRFKVRRTKNR